MRAPILCLLLAVGVAVPLDARVRAPQAGATETAAYYFLLARHHESAGKPDAAIAAMKRAIELDPKSGELYAELAGLFARHDKALEAVESAEAAIERDPGNTEAHRILGTVYAAFGEQRMALNRGDDPSTYPKRAIEALLKAGGDGADLGIDLMLGRLYLQTGAFDKALPLLARVVEDQPDFVDGVVLLSTAQESAGQIDQAVQTLRNLLRDHPESYRVQVRLAELYEREEQWNEAAEAYATAQGMNPRAQSLTGRRGVALLSAGRAAEAKALVEGVLGAGPTKVDPVLLYLLAESQRALKELDAAEATARKLVAATPRDGRGLQVLSQVLQDKGDLKGAERTLRDLIARDPLDANALNSLGYMLAERADRLDEAVVLVERALEIEPGNPSYLDSLGWAYFQQGNLERADQPLTDAAAKLETNSVVQDHLGDLRAKQRRFGEAVAAWERALAGDGQAIDRAKVEKKIRDARGRK